MPIARIARAEQFIRERMVLRAMPFRPDISIHTPTPQSGINAWLAGEGQDNEPPYWAYAWGGGAALALYLHDHPEVVAGRSVLDFGAGSGLVGIAAMKAGARTVLPLEPNPIGQVALKLNAEANGVALDLWTAPGLPQVNVVLAGDVFYSADVVAQTLPLLTQLAGRGAKVLVGDPFRRDLPVDRLELIAEYDVPDMGGPAPVRSGVFALR
ncbi:class I SAM-dependent methyltransferase [Devosia sediminis]|uniref:class I SAM-dependent methyltransferase n=1 Tax=Devosia sediminis TaxID=2798801 RepID=UPI002E2C3702|nr:50S ribosomal protein L11 methyltransferase [Devosia sediminis]